MCVIATGAQYSYEDKYLDLQSWLSQTIRIYIYLEPNIEHFIIKYTAISITYHSNLEYFVLKIHKHA